MTPTDFLLARIAEDEAVASTLHEVDCDLVTQGRVDPGFGWECSCGYPARVLAECEAKRWIVEKCAEIGRVQVWDYYDAPDLADAVLCALALPYADHPDYREEWRP